MVMVISSKQSKYRCKSKKCAIFYGNIANYHAKESLQNIVYPDAESPVDGGPLGIVNSNSWTNAVLASAGITPDNGGDYFGPELLHANRIDPDYFAANPNIGDLDVHNLDTDGDGQLDVFDDYPTDDSRH